MIVTIGRSQHSSTDVSEHALTREQILALVTSPHTPVASKDRAPWIVPGELAPCPPVCRNHGRLTGVDCGGGKLHRLAENVRAMAALFLDFDKQPPAVLAAAKEALDRQPYKWAIYTTSSFKGLDAPTVSFRLVVPFAAPVAVQHTAHWRGKLWPALTAALGIGALPVDAACSDVSRLYFLPCTVPGGAPGRTWQAPPDRVWFDAAGVCEDIKPGPALATVGPRHPETLRDVEASTLYLQLVASVRSPEDVLLLGKVRNGEVPWKEGERHQGMLRLTWLIAREAPDVSASSVVAFLEPLVAALEASDPSRGWSSELLALVDGAKAKQPQFEPLDEEQRRVKEEMEAHESGIALRLARLHGTELTADPARGILVWTGKVWRMDTGAATQLLKKVGDTYEADAERVATRIQATMAQYAELTSRPLEMPDAAVLVDRAREKLDTKIDALTAAQKRLCNGYGATRRTSNQAAILTQFRLTPECQRATAEFDADPTLLNTPSGIVELTEGRLLKHDPARLCTKITTAPYVEGVRSELWERTIAEILPEEETRESVQRILGYAITALGKEQMMFLWHGSGSNGKSLVLSLVTRALGDYYGRSAKTILTKAKEENTYERSDLQGKRLVWVEELGSHERLDSGKLKAVVSMDTVRARPIYEKPIEFPMQAKLILPCNTLPSVTEDDHGTWRRIVCVPFRAQFQENADKDLEAKLAATELPGILSWLVEGARKYLHDGLKLSQTIIAYSERHKAQEDRVAEFASEQLVQNAGERVLFSHVYFSYDRWCKKFNYKALSKITFGRRIRKAMKLGPDYSVRDNNNQLIFDGWKLLPDV